MTVRLMHVSDVHAGPPYDARVADIVLREAHAYAPDAFVVSGDFVQRADFADQWQTITTWLAQTPTPRIVVPGNHDVPLYNVWQRLFDPYRAYQTYISTDLHPVLHLAGVSLFGVNSAHGWTVDSGWVSATQLTQLRTVASTAPAGNRKVVVMHHHLVNPPGAGRRNRVANARHVAALFDEVGIDVVLSGHLHLSYVGHTRDVFPRLTHGSIICQAGTATSRRGKGREHHRFAYNMLEITTTQVTIRRHVYDATQHAFVQQATHIESFVMR
jgi:3',5'-cyclic AMP phosphodiesterase CpdA